MSLAVETESAYQSYAAMRPDIVLQAVLLCKDESFHRWIDARLQGCWGRYDEAMAVNYLREYCGIKSRSELKENEEAQQKFEALVKEFQRDRALGAVA